MNEFRRLLFYVRPYFAALLLSVVLMAAVGAAQGFTAVLIGPVFDRVLKPDTPDSPVALFTIPGFNRTVYLQDFLPSAIHNVWSMVAIAILATFLTERACAIISATISSTTSAFPPSRILRQTVFDRVLRQDAHFFESNSTGRVMSSIMIDLEKIQVATSHMLADWLRQSFSVVFLLFVVIQKDWLLALGSLTLLPFVLVPTARIGRLHSPHHSPRAGRRRRTQRDSAGNHQRPPGGEVVRRRRCRIEPLPAGGRAGSSGATFVTLPSRLCLRR